MNTTMQSVYNALPASGWLMGPAEQAGYCRDQRELFTVPSNWVALPESTQQVSKLLRACSLANVAVVTRGGGTGLVGGSIAWTDQLSAGLEREAHDDARPVITLSLARMSAIHSVDPENFSITVSAGTVLTDVQREAAQAGCYFPLSFAAEKNCHIGGNLATNAGGINVLRYGNARDLCLGLEVVTADGSIMSSLKGLRKDNSGYDLKQLFIGSEGTLGVITAAVLKLYPGVSQRRTLMLGLPDVGSAVSAYAQIKSAFGDLVTGCELMSNTAWQFAMEHGDNCRSPLTVEHNWYLLLELSASQGLPSMAEIESLEIKMADEIVVAADQQQATEFWHIRRSIPAAQGREGASIKHDISLPLTVIAEFVSEASTLAEALIPGVRACPFGHLGDGNLHFNFTQPTDVTRETFLSRWGELNRVVHDCVVRFNGSVAAEHGVGQLKTGELLRYKSETEMRMMKTLKIAFDPKNILNPGKVVSI